MHNYEFGSTSRRSGGNIIEVYVDIEEGVSTMSRGLFRTSFSLWGTNSFRDTKINDCFQLLITKKPVSFDYVAIDATALVATALRLSKHVSTEQRRNKEVARHVVQNLQQFLRKIHCKKSLLIALDGPESLLKTHTTRSSAITKRLESRLVRLPGTSLMQAVEERIVRLMPDRHISCSEVVVCGTRVTGGVEEKITSWALDLSCHPKHERNQETLTMLGPTELLMNVMSLTPYFHVSSLIQHGSDLRQIRWMDMLEWLELNELAVKGDSLRVARARTDALFLFLLSNGCSATDLPSIHGCTFSYVYHRYCEINGYRTSDDSNATGNSGKKNATTTPTSAKQTDDAAAADTALVQGEKGSCSTCGEEPRCVLFEDLPGNGQRLNLSVLYKVVQSTSTRMKEDKEGRADPTVDSYLAHAMQTHHMFCLGKTPLPDLLPMYLFQNTGGSTMFKSSSPSHQSAISMTQLAAHLKAMIHRGERGDHTYRSCTSFSSTGVSPACMSSGSGISCSGGGGSMSSSSSSSSRGARKLEPTSLPSSSSSSLASPEKTDLAGRKEERDHEDGRDTPSPAAMTSSAASPPSSGFIPHFQYLWSRHQPLTAAEFTILSYSQAHLVEAALQQYVGASPKPEVARKISDERKVGVAQVMTQEALSYANVEHPHPCVCYGPSYLWEKNEKTGVWTIAYIDVGAQSGEKSIRRYHNAKAGVSMSISEGSEEGPCFFDCRTNQLESINHYPLEIEEQRESMTAEALQELERVPNTVSPGATTGEASSIAFSTTTSSNASPLVDKEVPLLSIKGENADDSHPVLDTSTSMTKGVKAENAKILDPVGSVSSSSFPSRTSPSTEKIKVLTWNVMFDRYTGQPTPLGMPGIDWCSPQRYPVLSRCLERENADIIAIQEVEHAFARFLIQQPWCRDRYVLSCTPSSAVLDPWGVMMLIRRSRFTIKQLTHVNVPAWSGHVSLMPIVTLAFGAAKRRVLDVAAVHLIAPFTKANEAARTGQDAALRQRAVKGLGQDAIIMGDFNDWPGNEFLMPAETLYRECWPQLYPDCPGKTMDDTNTFCQLKVEEIFFGRSDKIFLRSRSIQPLEAHLMGTKSVNSENDNHDAPAYLFPSDHYGVSMTFSVPV